MSERAQPQAIAHQPPSTASTYRQLKGRAAASSSSNALARIHPDSLPGAHAVTNLDMDVTENCNLGCLYCFKGEMYPRQMTPPMMRRALEWLLEAAGTAESVNCNFMGGEPLMRWKQIRDFVPWARRRARARGKRVTFSMTTNLTLFTDEIREFVDAYGFGVLMSIDGCPEVQDAQRPAKNGKPTSAIVERWARSMLNTRPGSHARSTIHPDYVERFAEGVDYLSGIGFKEISVSLSEYEDWTDGHFEALGDQFRIVEDMIFDRWVAGGELGLTVLRYYINHLIRHRAAGQEDRIQWNPQPCGAGRGYMMIDYTGDIWPCHRFDGADADAGAEGQFRLGNIMEGGFNDLLQRGFVDFDHRRFHKAACPSCPANPICGGYCPAANLSDTGSVYTPHDNYCRWTWLAYERAESLYGRIYRVGGDVFEAFMQSVATAGASGEK